MMLVDQTRTVLEEIDFLRSQPAASLDASGKPKRKNASPERSVQVTLKRHLETVLPGCLVAAVKNEHAAAASTKKQRARFYQKRKAEGVKSGFPDLIITTPGRGVFFVETKAPVTGTLSETQREAHAYLRAQGHTVIVAESIETLRWGMAQAGIASREPAGQAMQPLRRALT